MKRSLLAFFLTFTLTIQVGLASALPNIKEALAKYNAFAIDPNTFTTYKIKGSLPVAKLTEQGAIELTLEKESILLEINQVEGVIRLNGKLLVFKSTDTFRSRVDQVEKILSVPKSTMLDSLFSFIIPSANADCLSKYSAAIDAFNKKPLKFTAAISFIAALIVPAVGLPALKATDDLDYAGRDRLHEVKASLMAAQEGVVPSDPKIPENEGPYPDTGLLYPNHQLCFAHMYNKYYALAKDQGSTPLSRKEFLNALADGDRKELFCNPTLLPNTKKVSEMIILQSSIDPNQINKNMPINTSTVDNNSRGNIKDNPIENKPADESTSGASK